jgi:hypothetical protein
MLRLVTLLAGAALIVLITLAVLARAPWKHEAKEEGVEYSAPFSGSGEPAAVAPPAVVAAAPEPPKAAPAPPAPIDDRVAEDAAAVGMTTMEPEDDGGAGAAPPNAPAQSADEPIT